MAQYPHALPCDSLPPRRTGHEDFPHPALPETLATGMRQEALAWPGGSASVSDERGAPPRGARRRPAPSGGSVVGSVRSKRPSRPLTPRVSGTAPSLPGHYPASPLLWAAPTPGPSRSGGYEFPPRVGGPASAGPGLPGSSTDLSARAVPTHPGEPGDCWCPLLRRRCWLQPLWEPGHSHIA